MGKGPGGKATKSAAGQMIRDARLARKLTVRALGESIGMSPTWVSRVETGAIIPTYDRLKTVAKALKLNITDLSAAAGRWEDLAKELMKDKNALALYRKIRSMNKEQVFTLLDDLERNGH